MALSMDEQRMLAEIERHLAAEEPGLAANLARLRKPGRVSVFRSTRARVIGSLFTVVVVAMVSLLVYALLPFRSGGRTTGHQPVTATSSSAGPGQAKIGVAPGGATKTRSSGTKTSAVAASTATQPPAQASSSSHAAQASSAAGAPSASAAYAQEHGQGSG